MTPQSTDTAHSYPPFFPMMVDLRARTCLVAGAGKIAAAKIDGLLPCCAHIEVVSPRAVREIKDKALAGAILWHKRRFVPEDLRGKFLVIAATGSASVNRAIFRACTVQGVLCNAVDQPEYCHFYYPAVVRRGPLQIAISTGGCSPALAARLRGELEQQFGPEWGAWVRHVGELRGAILAQSLTPATRARRLRQIVTSEALRAFHRAAIAANNKHRVQSDPAEKRRNRASVSATPTQ